MTENYEKETPIERFMQELALGDDDALYKLADEWNLEIPRGVIGRVNYWLLVHRLSRIALSGDVNSHGYDRGGDGGQE